MNDEMNNTLIRVRYGKHTIFRFMHCINLSGTIRLLLLVASNDLLDVDYMICSTLITRPASKSEFTLGVGPAFANWLHVIQRHFLGRILLRTAPRILVVWTVVLLDVLSSLRLLMRSHSTWHDGLVHIYFSGISCGIDA